MLGGDRQDVYAYSEDFVQRQAELMELLDFQWMAPETLPDTRIRPAKRLTCLQGHESVGHVMEYMR